MGIGQPDNNFHSKTSFNIFNTVSVFYFGVVTNDKVTVVRKCVLVLGTIYYCQSRSRSLEEDTEMTGERSEWGGEGGGWWWWRWWCSSGVLTRSNEATQVMESRAGSRQ